MEILEIPPLFTMFWLFLREKTPFKFDNRKLHLNRSIHNEQVSDLLNSCITQKKYLRLTKKEISAKYPFFVPTTW
jgi:hypothetical protein